MYQHQLRQALHEAVEQQGQESVSNQGSEEALGNALADERLADVGRCGAYELHAAHEETFGVDAEAYGVANQRDGDDEEHQAGHHQHQADTADVLVDDTDQRLMVIDFLDVFVFKELCLNEIEAVGGGSTGMEAHVDGGQQRVLFITEPLQEVLAQIFAQASYGFLLGDVFRRLHGRHSVEFVWQLEDVALLDVAVHHDFEADVFLEIVGEFMGMQHEQGKNA